MELTEIDFKILARAVKANGFKIEYILSKLPDDEYNTEHRLKELVNRNYIERLFMLQGQSPSGNPIQTFTGEYKITDLGKKILQNYKLKSNKERFLRRQDLFFKVISTIALLKSFDNEIARLLRFLSQIVRDIFVSFW